ncbi:MAG: YbjN domain-containing protein [candidate division KSB1 bacterium]|nr:YbjN domain-containing protein [candidate division KSB1 bacterium]
MDEAKIIPEDLVTAKELADLLQQEEYSAQVDEDGEVRVTMGEGTFVYIAIDTVRRLLKFYTLFRFRPNAPLASKLTLVNRMNDEVIFVRFSMAATDILFTDYFLSYDGGLLWHQFLRSLAWFSRVAVSAVAEFDEDDLVQ